MVPVEFCGSVTGLTAVVDDRFMNIDLIDFNVFVLGDLKSGPVSLDSVPRCLFWMEPLCVAEVPNVR